jgi:hypothetical protein
MVDNVIDLSEILKPYIGKWVAISEDKKMVICAADTIEEVIQGSKSFKDGEPVILRVPDEQTAHLL